MRELQLPDIYNLEDILNTFNPSVRIWIIQTYNPEENEIEQYAINHYVGSTSIYYMSSFDYKILITFRVRLLSTIGVLQPNDIELDLREPLLKMGDNYNAELFAALVYEMLDKEVRQQRGISLYKE